VVLRRPHILAVNQICWVLLTEPAPSRIDQVQRIHQRRAQLGRHDGHGHRGVSGHAVRPRTVRPRPRRPGGDSMAQLRQISMTSQRRQTTLPFRSGGTQGRHSRSGRTARGPRPGRQHGHVTSRIRIPHRTRTRAHRGYESAFGRPRAWPSSEGETRSIDWARPTACRRTAPTWNTGWSWGRAAL